MRPLSDGETPASSGLYSVSCIRSLIERRLHPLSDSVSDRVDAGDTLSDSGCRRNSIRQQMQETLYQTADTEVSLSDSGGRSLSIRQRMQKSLYQTADAGVSLSDN